MFDISLHLVVMKSYKQTSVMRPVWQTRGTEKNVQVRWQILSKMSFVDMFV